MKKLLFPFFIFVLLSNTISQVFDIEKGKVEFIGLKKMQPKELLDSMRTLHPNTPVHPCASEMIKDFGFAEVSSMMEYIGNKKYYFIVTIVEDNSQGKIQYLQEQKDSLEIIPEYAGIAKIFDRNPIMMFQLGLRAYELFKDGKPDSARNFVKNFGVQADIIIPLWEFLKQHQNLSDLNLALWVLNNDSNPLNRQTAITILANFDSYENVWWTLMNLQRDKNNLVSGIASELLRDFTGKPTVINWKPALPILKHILSGTNLFAFTNTLDVLEKTKFSPDLAAELLKGNCDLLCCYLHAEHESTRNAAISFIKYLSKNNNLAGAQECENWLKQYN